MNNGSEAGKVSRIKAVLERHEAQVLCAAATPSSAARRRQADPKEARDYRNAFALDADRILHSLAYTRYIDKTQVFYLVRNDHITHRVLHVQLVAKIARTIGRCLGLNEDLIEAIALGHDIGHAPFGHEGEGFLSALCVESGIGAFHHNVQSVQFLEHVERKGSGLNLTLQTLDGILCHDGEIHNQQLTPVANKDFTILYAQIEAKKADQHRSLMPATLEGCVMRMADTISYIGRDVEDAIRLGLIKRREMPKTARRLLGDTNGKIVFSLVTDLITNSRNQPFIAFSEGVSEALSTLKRFNYQRIYLNPKLKTQTKRVKALFELLYSRYLNDLEQERHGSVIFSAFLDGMSERYLISHQPAEIVRDFLAGMTDHYFLSQCPTELRPQLLML
jgi:dGTPase